MPGDPAVLVMARAPRPGEAKTRLEPLLGPDGCARLQAALIGRGVAWAREVAGRRVWVAYTPDDAREELRALAGEEVRLTAQHGGHLGERLIAATGEVFDAHEGPLLVIGTDLPVLGRRHAEGALRDLAEGVNVTFGPAADGGYYLVALDAPHPEVFAIPADAWGGSTVFEQSLRAAREASLELGMLRIERDLDTPEDARFVLADPRTPPEIAELLRRAKP